MSTHYTRPTNERPNVFFPDTANNSNNSKTTPENSLCSRDKLINQFKVNNIPRQPTSTFESTSSINAPSLINSQPPANTGTVFNLQDLDDAFQRLKSAVSFENKQISIEKQKYCQRFTDIYKSKLDEHLEVSTVNQILTKENNKQYPITQG
jgi:hypothetical protein